MWKRFFQNTRKPEGVGGRLMLTMMNIGHNRNALWGLAQVEIPPTARILDIGCGGGQNISNLLTRAPQGSVCGVDYSPESVEKSRRTNRAAVRQGRASAIQASVSALPFSDREFDLATAFETVYFWPDLLHDLGEVQRVLKEGGIFLICNEAARPEGFGRWIDMLDMSIYTKEELSQALLQAGFCNIVCHEHPNGRGLCVTAQKPDESSSAERSTSG